MLQHRLPAAPTRATKDVDGLIRGDIEDFILKLDDVLTDPWGPLSLRRSKVEVIETPARVIKPRRFDIILEIKGKTWRKIQVEIASEEGSAGDEPERFIPPPLDSIGLPSSEELVGLSLRYQAAQKIHACSDPHDTREPPAFVNDRVRDVVDLLLLRDVAELDLPDRRRTSADNAVVSTAGPNDDASSGGAPVDVRETQANLSPERTAACSALRTPNQVALERH